MSDVFSSVGSDSRGDSSDSREFRVRYHDLELAVKSWGRPEARPDKDGEEGAGLDGVPLIALHGWMDNVGTFEKLVPALNHFPFYALDFSGHGCSDHRSASDDYYIWGYVEEVLAVLDHLQIERCIVLGHSMGGAVATLLAAIYPQRVERLILLDSVGPLATAENDLPQQLCKSLESKRASIGARPRHYKSRHEAEQSRANSGITLASAAILGLRGLAQDAEGYYWRTDQKLKRRNPVSMSEAQVRAFLSQIDMPSLLVAAAPNYANSVAGVEQRLACIKPLQIKQLPGNHFQHLEGHVEAVADSVRTFLSAVDGPIKDQNAN